MTQPLPKRLQIDPFPQESENAEMDMLSPGSVARELCSFRKTNFDLAGDVKELMHDLRAMPDVLKSIESKIGENNDLLVEAIGELRSTLTTLVEFMREAEALRIESSRVAEQAKRQADQHDAQ